MLALRTTPEEPFGSPRSVDDVEAPRTIPNRHGDGPSPSICVAGLDIVRLVAEGGMGLVYEARIEASGDVVALKVLKLEHAGDAGLVRRFEDEIAYADRVAHPNVAPVLGRGRASDGRPYYITRLYEGLTLGALVRLRGRLPVERVLAIADGILAGIAALHEVDVVHGDLHPDNVFLARVPGAPEMVKLLDLGFAREPGVDRGDGLTLESRGALVGSRLFMSPEQATCSRAITKRSDLFATALLLYYALTAALPFRGATDPEVARAIVRRAPVSIRRERRGLPAAIDSVLSRALAKHPDARFESASAMRARIAEIS